MIIIVTDLRLLQASPDLLLCSPSYKLRSITTLPEFYTKLQTISDRNKLVLGASIPRPIRSSFTLIWDYNPRRLVDQRSLLRHECVNP